MKKSENNSKRRMATSAAGGFVAGAAIGGATGVMASNTGEEPKEELTVENGEPTRTPEPEDSILADSEGVRVEHVDADNFPKASTPNVVEYHEATVEPQDANETQVVHNEELVSEEVTDEVRVLGVEAVQNEDGSIMNVAVLDSGGDHALMVDVDNDGLIEVLVHDDNYDGEIQENEIHNIADAGIQVDDLLMAQAAQQGDFLATCNDDMPDYLNDSDLIMEA